jgi:hypothetical protein
VVRLLLVPKVLETDEPIPDEELELTRHIRDEVHSYLDERRLLATRLEIMAPQYVPVAVMAQVRAKAGSDSRQVAADVEKRLYRYINPVHGGLDESGWPFGRSLSLSDVYAVIQKSTGVDYVDEVELFSVENGERTEATTKIGIPANSLLCSHKHEIMVE